jgi:hypothetical protein
MIDAHDDGGPFAADFAALRGDIAAAEGASTMPRTPIARPSTAALAMRGCSNSNSKTCPPASGVLTTDQAQPISPSRLIARWACCCSGCAAFPGSAARRTRTRPPNRQEAAAAGQHQHAVEDPHRQGHRRAPAALVPAVAGGGSTRRTRAARSSRCRRATAARCGSARPTSSSAAGPTCRATPWCSAPPTASCWPCPPQRRAKMARTARQRDPVGAAHRRRPGGGAHHRRHRLRHRTRRRQRALALQLSRPGADPARQQHAGGGRRRHHRRLLRRQAGASSPSRACRSGKPRSRRRAAAANSTASPTSTPTRWSSATSPMSPPTTATWPPSTSSPASILWRRELSAHAGLSADETALYITDSEDNLWAADPATAPDAGVRRDCAPAPDRAGAARQLPHGRRPRGLCAPDLAPRRTTARLRASRQGPHRPSPVVDGGVAYVYANDGTSPPCAPDRHRASGGASVSGASARRNSAPDDAETRRSDRSDPGPAARDPTPAPPREIPPRFESSSRSDPAPDRLGRKATPCSQSSPWWAAPTSANRRCSTGSRAPATPWSRTFRGLTRDRQYGIGRIGPGPIVVVDTGGISGGDGVEVLMERQVQARHRRGRPPAVPGRRPRRRHRGGPGHRRRTAPHRQAADAGGQQDRPPAEDLAARSSTASVSATPGHRRHPGRGVNGADRARRRTAAAAGEDDSEDADKGGCASPSSAGPTPASRR